MPPKKPVEKKISKKERDAEDRRRIEEENRIAQEKALKAKELKEKEEKEARDKFFTEVTHSYIHNKHSFIISMHPKWGYSFRNSRPFRRTPLQL